MKLYSDSRALQRILIDKDLSIREAADVTKINFSKFKLMLNRDTWIKASTANKLTKYFGSDVVKEVRDAKQD